MSKYKELSAFFSVLLWVLSVPCSGEQVWRLSPETGWEEISDSPQGKFLLRVSEIKQQIERQDTEEAMRALETLETDFPQFAGPDLSLYIEGEKLYIKNKWSKAAVKYKKCLTDYPDSPLVMAAAERLYSIGAAYMGGQKRPFLKIFHLPAYEEGEKILRDLSDRWGNAPLAYRSLVTIAESQERREKFLDAYQTWAEIADRWPTGESGRIALLRMAQSLHAAYRSPHYDATVLRGAASYFEDYRKRYEASAAELGIDQKLEMIREQQAYKDFFVGLYYERTEQLEAAMMYYRLVADKYPQSRAAQMALQHQTAIEQGKSLLPPKTMWRKVFEAGADFLDHWFGVGYIVDLPTGQERTPRSTAEGTNRL
jgi:outer membrane protein assembly factor BamD (BamD/ComL family)